MKILNQICQSGVCSHRTNSRKISGCTTNCSSPNGQCNNLGKCHCQIGYDPFSNCAAQGSGGSVDGGPASDPSGVPTFYVELYIIFLAIVPIVLFLVVCWYFNLDQSSKARVRLALRRQHHRLPDNLAKQKPSLTKQSASIEKNPQDNNGGDGNNKRNFGQWVRNSVQLKLPIIIAPHGLNESALLDSSPVSGSSTATTACHSASPLGSPKVTRQAPPPPVPAQSNKPRLLVVHPPPPPPPPPSSHKPQLKK